MKRYLVCERASLGRIYDGMGLELWGCGEEEPWFGSFGLGMASPSIDFDDGTLVGEGSGAICGDDRLQGPTSSFYHPDPFTPPGSLGLTLPRASSAGLAVYEDTALLADMLSASPTPRAV